MMFMMINLLNRYGCKSYLLRNLEELGFKEPTSIQRQAIPVLLSVCSSTKAVSPVFVCRFSFFFSFFSSWRGVYAFIFVLFNFFFFFFYFCFFL